MTTPTPECPACRVRMQDGFVADARDHGSLSRTRWTEGSPVQRWTGLSVKGHRQLDTVTFRCPKCGWLIWFAPDDAGSKES